MKTFTVWIIRTVFPTSGLCRKLIVDSQEHLDSADARSTTQASESQTYRGHHSPTALLPPNLPRVLSRRALTLLPVLLLAVFQPLLGADAASYVTQTIPDNTLRTKGQSSTNAWSIRNIRNSGTTTWNSNYSLQHVSGSFCGQNPVAVSGTVAPGFNATFSISCAAPTAAGSYTVAVQNGAGGVTSKS
jgi:hypothetical protein